MKKKILILLDNHFDLTWRRCFDREFTWKGKNFVSYAQIEDYYITDHLAYAEKVPGYRFQIESTAVVRKYLERHPKKKDCIRKYLADGTIYIPFSGDNIIDTNMTHGETIVRNFVYGKLWLEDNLNFSPDICTRNDAFGNCGQIPQIVKGCEGDWVTSISYCPLNGDIWEGLDGSRLKHLSIQPIGSGGGVVKYPPCPECYGEIQKRKNCSVCGGRGIDLEMARRVRIAPRLEKTEKLKNNGWGVLAYGGEEILPNEDIFRWIEAHKEEYDISFGTMPMIRALGEPADESSVFSGDLNPSSTGCFVTRIKTKQLLRKAEYSMLNAEVLGVMAVMKGWEYPKKKADEIWEKILFAAFHDAVTGTHIDASYDELLDIFGEIQEGVNEIREDSLSFLTNDDEKMISVINPTGNYTTGLIRLPNKKKCFVVKDMKPYEVRWLSLEDIVEEKIEKIIFGETDHEKSAMLVLRGDVVRDEDIREMKHRETIENSRYRIIADECGILEIYDKKLERVLSNEGKYRPGEWILEHDEGSPWTTLSDDRRRFRLAPFTRLVRKETSEGMARFCFRTVPPMDYGYGIDGIDITTTVTLYEGLDRIEFEDDVKWDTMNHRLRLAMPVCIQGKSLYEVPYGFMERKPYYRPIKDESYMLGWNDANGDWAAINWAGVSGRECSVALLNKGIPSYIIEEDTLFLSVLRSPGVPICLHEGRAYTMLDFDGMRDTGIHHHEFALAAYDCPLPESTVVTDADSYQAGLICVEGSVEDCDMPFVSGEGIRISSVKKAQKQDGIVIRLVETAGKSGKAIVHVPVGFKNVYETNMMERKEKRLDMKGSQVELLFEPFKIKTLVCRRT